MPMITNTFENGMQADALPYLQPKGTYRYMKNMKMGDRLHRGYGVSFEEGTKELHNFGTITGASYVESLDASIFFTAANEIWLYDHTLNKDTFVCSAAEFGCDWDLSGCNWISHTIKTDQPCDDVKVYFADSTCHYRVVNITEMLNPNRKRAVQQIVSDDEMCGGGCEYFNLMRCTRSPIIVAEERVKAGHRIEAGSYQFLAKLTDNEGNDTNWFTVSEPVSVSSKNNRGGELSESAIDVHITGIDCRYDRIQIAVIKNVDQVKTSEIVAERGFSTDGITFTYTGQIGKAISFGEIYAKRKMYLRGRDVGQKDGRLWLYGIRQEKNLNMQARVIEQVQINFREMIVPARTAEKYQMRTYMRGENYLFGIVYNYCDGTKSKVFVAAPKGGGGGGSGASVSIQTPSGEAKNLERPRGGQPAPGGAIGCPQGNCGPNKSNSSSGDDSGEASLEPQPDQVKENVDDWDTTTSDGTESTTCDNCKDEYCCDSEGNVGQLKPKDPEVCAGCAKNEQAIGNDIPNLEDIVAKHFDEISDYLEDKEIDEVEYTSNTWKDFAQKLIKQVRNSEVKIGEKDKFNVSQDVGGSSGGPQAGGEAKIATATIEEGDADESDTTTFADGSSFWADRYSDAKGHHMVDGNVQLGATIAPEIQPSTERYPTQLDCDGNPMYGGYAGQPVQLFKAPTADKSPIVKPGVVGVPSSRTPGIEPIYQNEVILLGVEVSSVPQPTAEDLPKPLDSANPWSLVVVARDHANSTVQAKGIAFGTFYGQSAGQTLIYPRHGACSPVNVDGFIDNDGSRQGSGSAPAVTFHGLDTDITKVGLSGDTLRGELFMRGLGWRYGLYEKGEEPEDRLNGRRIDQRGARQYINLNLPTPFSATPTIRGLSYLEPNSVTKVDNITEPVSTRLRESSVFIGASFGGATDDSFYSDTRDHEAPVRTSHGWYCAIVRDIPDQYGSIIGMNFIDTGIKGRNFSAVHRGIAGDSFISPYTFLRTGYVSDKVGDYFPLKAAGYERDRTVCDSPDDKAFQELGINWYPTQLPISGDDSDAKNWAGGYQKQKWNAVSGPPNYDFYYVKTQKTLITTWVESRVNGWLRATGLDDYDMYYPKTKGKFLDSNLSSKHPWEKSYLNSILYYRVEQPSVVQLEKKAMFKGMINLIMPSVGVLSTFLGMDGVVDTTLGVVGLTSVIPVWYFLKKLIAREDYLDKMLGLPLCVTDASGGERDNYIENYRDNYHDYNYDYSKLNYENVYETIPLTYNTCDCDNCDEFTTNEIFYSNKQVIGSQIDAYKHFKAFNYLQLPADSGTLKKLFAWNGGWYAHTTDFIYQIRFQGVQSQSSIGTSLLGGNEMVLDPHPLMEGVPEGYAGNTDPNAAITTKYGYIWIDRPARKLYMFNGSVRELSVDNQLLFKEHIDFCGSNDCIDEKVEGTLFYSLGYDSRYDRILVTKNDGEDSFTISYKLDRETPRMEGIYDFIPQAYLWDRHDLYAIKGGTLYMHNDQDAPFRTYYGKSYPAELEAVGILDGGAFKFKNLTINSEAEKNHIKNLDVTFNKLAIFNNSQSTGIVPIEVESDNNSSVVSNLKRIEEDPRKFIAHKNNRKFKINNVRDKVPADCNDPLITQKDKCILYPSVANQPQCHPQNSSFERSVLMDDYISYRFIYDKDNETQLRLIAINTDVETNEKRQ